jgi:hypothetical protein
LRTGSLGLAIAVGAAAGAAAAAGATLVVLAVSVVVVRVAATGMPFSSHAIAEAWPPRLPPFMALPVAVHPLPAVDVGGGAPVVDCATATPPITRAAAPI